MLPEEKLAMQGFFHGQFDKSRSCSGNVMSSLAGNAVGIPVSSAIALGIMAGFGDIL
jgi:hypothetical protein